MSIGQREPFHKSVVLRVGAVSAAIIAGAFWVALSGYKGGMFFVAPVCTFVGALIVGIYANSLVEAEKENTRKMAARLFQVEMSREHHRPT